MAKILYLLVIFCVTATSCKPYASDDENKNNGAGDGVQKVPLPLAIAPTSTETPTSTENKQRLVREATTTPKSFAVHPIGVLKDDATEKTSGKPVRNVRSAEDHSNDKKSGDPKRFAREANDNTQKKIGDIQTPKQPIAPNTFAQKPQVSLNQNQNNGNRPVRETEPKTSNPTQQAHSALGINQGKNLETTTVKSFTRQIRQTKEQLSPPGTINQQKPSNIPTPSTKPEKRLRRDVESSSTPKGPQVKLAESTSTSPKPTERSFF